MFSGRSVAVVIPAFNEEQAIARTVRAVPGFVDRVIVVDDASQDRTGRLASRSRRRGLEVLRHDANRGVGGAIVTGYRRALALGIDVTCVMAGDGQMDPADLPTVLAPIAEGRADYVKGNRFLRGDVWRVMPPSRIAGNLVLSCMTKITSGYWEVFDSQCGYTAASRRSTSIGSSRATAIPSISSRVSTPPARAWRTSRSAPSMARPGRAASTCRRSSTRSSG